MKVSTFMLVSISQTKSDRRVRDLPEARIWGAHLGGAQHGLGSGFPKLPSPMCVTICISARGAMCSETIGKRLGDWRSPFSKILKFGAEA